MTDASSTPGFTKHTVAYVNDTGTGFELREETHRNAPPMEKIPLYKPLPGCTTHIVAYVNDTATGFEFHEETSCILSSSPPPPPMVPTMAQQPQPTAAAAATAKTAADIVKHVDQEKEEK